MYGVAIYFVPLNYLFLSFCSLSLGDLGEILAINLQKWSPLESLYRCFFVYDFDRRFFGRSAGAVFFKMQNSLLRICFENQQKLWFSTQIHMSTVPFTEIIVDTKIHPLTIFISRFTACHYPNIYHQSHLSHSSNHSSQIIHFINYQQKSTCIFGSPPKTNMTIKHPPFESMYLLWKNGDFPASPVSGLRGFPLVLRKKQLGTPPFEGYQQFPTSHDFSRWSSKQPWFVINHSLGL